MLKSITTTSTVRDGSGPTEPESAARLHARVNPPQHNDGFTLHTRTALLTHNDCLTRPDYDRRGSQSDGSYDRRCRRGSDPRATWHASHPTGTAHRQSPTTPSFDPAHPHLWEEVKITVLAKYSLTLRYSVDIYGGLVSPLVSLVTSYAKLDKT